MNFILEIKEEPLGQHQIEAKYYVLPRVYVRICMNIIAIYIY